MATKKITKFPEYFGISNANIASGLSLNYFESVLNSIDRQPNISEKEKDTFKVEINNFKDVMLSYEKELTPLDVITETADIRLAAIKEALQLLDALKKGNSNVDLQFIISKLESVANDS